MADFNNDGKTDLISVAGNNISILYNNGDATFNTPDVIAPMPSFWGVATLDYNRDGLMDIYWTTYNDSPNTLLKNNGDGTFSDVTIDAGVSYTKRGHALDVGDYNNDGWIDIYVGSYSSLNCALFSNNGDGTFTDVATITGTSGNHDTRTSTFIDYDNNGWLDIFSSHHNFYSYSNTMLKNNGDSTFTEVAPSLGISGEWIGDYFGVGWADYNLDGAVDFFAAGHISPGKYNLFQNNDCPGNYLSVNLQGIESNPNGIGAQVDVWMSGNKISRNVLADGGIHDFSDFRINFGLAETMLVDSMVIYWPSGIVQVINNIEANQFITITEDESTSIKENEKINHCIKATFKPNPTNNIGVLSYSIFEKSKVEISLINSSGQKVKEITNNIIEQGDYETVIDINELQPGIYFIRIVNLYTSEVIRIVVI